MSSALELLRHFTSSWSGDAVNGEMLLRILHPDGTKPPLVWCFNSAHEFPMLAAGLGADQPLIGIRSLHLVTRIGRSRFSQDDQIAQVFADALLASGVDLDGCTVGGNCQGGNIAGQLAPYLRAAGIGVKRLILMETAAMLPFPGPVGLIYGAESCHNPLRTADRPEERWGKYFREYRIEIIPGAHGEFFTEANAATTSAAIGRLVDAPARITLEQACDEVSGLELIAPPTIAVAGQALDLQLQPVGAATSPDPTDRVTVHGIWVCPNDVVEAPEALLQFTNDPGGQGRSLKINVPKDEGHWDLRLFPCSDAVGPIFWAYHHARRYPIEVRSSS